MSILFYDHLIIKSEVIEIISRREDPENLKGKALQLVDDIIYQGIVEHLLKKLDSSKHTSFLSLMSDRPYDPRLLEFLRENIGPEIENEIKQTGNKLIKKIIKDLS